MLSFSTVKSKLRQMNHCRIAALSGQQKRKGDFLKKILFPSHQPLPPTAYFCLQHATADCLQTANPAAHQRLMGGPPKCARADLLLIIPVGLPLSSLAEHPLFPVGAPDGAPTELAPMANRDFLDQWWSASWEC